MNDSEAIQLSFWTKEFKRVRHDLPDETAERLARVHMSMHGHKGACATIEAALMEGLKVLEKKLGKEI